MSTPSTPTPSGRPVSVEETATPPQNSRRDSLIAIEALDEDIAEYLDTLMTRPEDETQEQNEFIAERYNTNEIVSALSSLLEAFKRLLRFPGLSFNDTTDGLERSPQRLVTQLEVLVNMLQLNKFVIGFFGRGRGGKAPYFELGFLFAKRYFSGKSSLLFALLKDASVATLVRPFS
jgi:hypothetical protein